MRQRGKGKIVVYSLSARVAPDDRVELVIVGMLGYLYCLPPVRIVQSEVSRLPCCVGWPPVRPRLPAHHPHQNQQNPYHVTPSHLVAILSDTTITLIDGAVNMTYTDPIRLAVTEGLEAAATAEMTPRSQRGDYEISVYPVTDAGAFVAATTGTATVTIVTQSSGGVAEPLLDAAGSPVVVNLTAAQPTTLVVERCSLVRVIATPDSLTGATVAGIRLAVYEAE